MSITCQTNQKLEEIEIMVILNMTNLKIIMADTLHQQGGYSRKDGRYYEGGHGENISDESKRESGKPFSKQKESN